MRHFRTLALLVVALAVVLIVRMQSRGGLGHGGEVEGDPRRPVELRDGDGMLLLELKPRVHGSWTAEMKCEDLDTGAVVLEAQRVRSSREPTLVSLPAGTYRVVLDGMPRPGERGERNEVCGRSESVVTLRSGEDTRLEVREPEAAALILMVVDEERALTRPTSEARGSHPDGIYLDAGRTSAPHEVVFFRNDEGSKTFGTWSPWSSELPDEVSGPVPAGEFTLTAVAHGRTLGRVPVKFVDGEITRVVLRVE